MLRGIMHDHEILARHLFELGCDASTVRESWLGEVHGMERSQKGCRNHYAAGKTDAYRPATIRYRPQMTKPFDGEHQDCRQKGSGIVWNEPGSQQVTAKAKRRLRHQKTHSPV